MTAIRPHHLVFDCVNVGRTSEFWSALLDAKVSSASEGWAELEPVAGLPVLAFQAVPETRTVKNRVHLDFAVDDLDAVRRRVLELGGAELGPVQGTSSVWQTFADVEGNEFCMCG